MGFNLDNAFDALDSALDGTERALQRNRREWKAARDQRVGDKSAYMVFHSFKTHNDAECGVDFADDTSYVRLTGQGFANVCEKCLLIRDKDAT